MRPETSTPRARRLRKDATDAERALWARLRNRLLGGFKFRRQHALGPFFVDFVCIEARTVVELDGGQHVDRAAEDDARTRWLQANGFRVVRYWNDEVLQRLDDVLGDLLRVLEERPHPNPLPQAGEGVQEPDRPHPSPLPQAGERAHQQRPHRGSLQPTGEGARPRAPHPCSSPTNPESGSCP